MGMGRGSLPFAGPAGGRQCEGEDGVVGGEGGELHTLVCRHAEQSTALLCTTHTSLEQRKKDKTRQGEPGPWGHGQILRSRICLLCSAMNIVREVSTQFIRSTPNEEDDEDEEDEEEEEEWAGQQAISREREEGSYSRTRAS